MTRLACVARHCSRAVHDADDLTVLAAEVVVELGAAVLADLHVVLQGRILVDPVHDGPRVLQPRERPPSYVKLAEIRCKPRSRRACRNASMGECASPTARSRNSMEISPLPRCGKVPPRSQVNVAEILHAHRHGHGTWTWTWCIHVNRDLAPGPSGSARE